MPELLLCLVRVPRVCEGHHAGELESYQLRTRPHRLLESRESTYDPWRRREEEGRSCAVPQSLRESREVAGMVSVRALRRMYGGSEHTHMLKDRPTIHAVKDKVNRYSFQSCSESERCHPLTNWTETWVVTDRNSHKEPAVPLVIGRVLVHLAGLRCQYQAEALSNPGDAVAKDSHPRAFAAARPAALPWKSQTW